MTYIMVVGECSQEPKGRMLNFSASSLETSKSQKVCICNVKRGWIYFLRADRSIFSNTEDSEDLRTQLCWFLFPGPIVNAIIRSCTTDKTPFQSEVLFPF